MDYEAIINHIQSNANCLDNETTQVTITEGKSVHQIAQLLEGKKIFVQWMKFWKLQMILIILIFILLLTQLQMIKIAIICWKDICSRILMISIPVKTNRCTLSKLLNNYKDKITQEMKDKAASMNMTMDQVITLASMIQAEAAKCG